MDHSLTLIPPILGIVGLIAAFVIYLLVKRYPEGEAKVREIAQQIHDGAMTFMRREYSLLAIFAIILLILLLLDSQHLGWKTAVAFVFGAFASAGAGWFGMYTATKANVRTTTAAQVKGPAAALSAAFFGGSIMGLAVASLGLLGLGLVYYLFGSDPVNAHHIHGFGMGASTVALFSRVGGGIYTKSADVGADLVGKTEENIPEDDPRNPGVIADNVGDNVGDIAGMGSDIFESYCGSMIASIAIASTLSSDAVINLFAGVVNPDEVRGVIMFLPLALASLGLICSILGIVLVRTQSNRNPALALRLGMTVTPILFIIGAFFLVTQISQLSVNLWWCVLTGYWWNNYWLDHRVLHIRTTNTKNSRTRQDRSSYSVDFRFSNWHAVSCHTDFEYCGDYFCFNLNRGTLWCRYCSSRFVSNGWYDDGSRCLRPSRR